MSFIMVVSWTIIAIIVVPLTMLGAGGCSPQSAGPRAKSTPVAPAPEISAEGGMLETQGMVAAEPQASQSPPSQEVDRGTAGSEAERDSTPRQTAEKSAQTSAAEGSPALSPDQMTPGHSKPAAASSIEGLLPGLQPVTESAASPASGAASGPREAGGTSSSAERSAHRSADSLPVFENPLRPRESASTTTGAHEPGPGGVLPAAVAGGSGGSPGTASAASSLSGGSPEKGRPLKGKKGAPFDPIKENGPIFVGWPKPRFALVLTGRMDGYLEPCGCAGLDRMKGGLSRRLAMFQQLRQQWGCPVVGLDAGGLIKGFGRQAELKFHLTVEAMRRMGYEAIGFGTAELKLPAGELLAVAANLDGGSALFLSANVALFDFESGYTAQTKIIEVAGAKIGVTSILGDRWQVEVQNADVQMRPAGERLAAVVAELHKEADLLILLAHASGEETRQLAARFPQFSIVVTAGTPPEPPPQPERLPSGGWLIETGTKGMDAIVLGFYDDPKEPIRYQRVPLDSRFPQAEEVQLLLADYQEQLKLLGLDGLGIRPAPHPRYAENGAYVGSKKCEPCHEISYDIWRKTGHAKAWQTLLELEIPRNFDPECISCHVIGWHPTKYFPYQGGFLSEAETPHLIDVGCEACHGPGEKHVQAEMGSDFELQRKYQKAMVITLEESKQWQCASCHDLDNSPDFDFDTYWPIVQHYEE